MLHIVGLRCLSYIQRFFVTTMCMSLDLVCEEKFAFRNN